jgi:hypothetical protein
MLCEHDLRANIQGEGSSENHLSAARNMMNISMDKVSPFVDGLAWFIVVLVAVHFSVEHAVVAFVGGSVANELA